MRRTRDLRSTRAEDLDFDALDFIESNLIPCSIMYLRCARAFMCSRSLRVLEDPASFEVSSQSGCREAMRASP
jgi:hypothetical protein